MSVLIGLLTTVLVLNCFFLVLLILIQLPKKESGSGLAFGGGTLDMALGARAGNMLTELTKVSASLFLLLCLVLAIIGNPGKDDISARLGANATPATTPATTPTSTPITTPATVPATTPAAASVEAEVTDKVDDALAGAADNPAPQAPEAPLPPAAPEKPAETPAAPPEGGEKK